AVRRTGFRIGASGARGVARAVAAEAIDARPRRALRGGGRSTTLSIDQKALPPLASLSRAAYVAAPAAVVRIGRGADAVAAAVELPCRTANPARTGDAHAAGALSPGRAIRIRRAARGASVGAAKKGGAGLRRRRDASADSVAGRRGLQRSRGA